LKDFVCRYKIQSGKRVSYIPGWDCHGLPIELKALQNLRSQQVHTPVTAAQAAEDSKALTAKETRSLARELALKAVEDQKAGFKSWAVLGDWDNSWRTMGTVLSPRITRMRI